MYMCLHVCGSPKLGVVFGSVYLIICRIVFWMNPQIKIYSFSSYLVWSLLLMTRVTGGHHVCLAPTLGIWILSSHWCSVLTNYSVSSGEG